MKIGRLIVSFMGTRTGVTKENVIEGSGVASHKRWSSSKMNV